MANTPTPNYEIPAEMRDFAEKSVEQARKAVDSFLSAARRTVDTFEGSANTVQSSAKDMTRKTLSYAEQNLSAAFDHAQKLVRARDVQEAVQLQSEFVRSQFAAMQAQMKEFGSLAQSAVSQGVRNAQDAANQGARTVQDAADQANQAGRGGTSRK
jgi:phasin